MNQRLFPILMLLIAFVGCAKQRIIMQEFRTEQIIHCSQMKNIENISDYVIYLDKGDKIPLKITLYSEVIDIESEEIDLILKQKVYFKLRTPEDRDVGNNSKMSEENTKDVFQYIMIYLSLDAKSWVPYTDIKAVKKVFGMQGGFVSFGMGLTKEDGIRIFLNAKTIEI